MENKKTKSKKNFDGIKSGLKFIPATIVEAVAGRYIGKIVLAMQHKKSDHWEKCKKETEEFLSTYKEKYPSLEISTFSLDINKKTNISSLEIKPQDNTNTNQNPRENIIVFMGNTLYCEKFLPDFCDWAKELDANVISFNYRGKGNSKGKAKNISQLVSDGKAQVERLLEKGIDPENITLYGQCFGGHIATLVASELHNENKKVYLFNDRAFTKISKVVLGLYGDITDDTNNSKIKKFALKAVKKIGQPGINLALNLSGWDKNSGKAFLQIPDKYADYIVVQNSKESKKSLGKFNLKLFDDGLIAEKASLHYFLKEKRKNTKQMLKNELNEVSGNIKNIKSISANKDSSSKKQSFLDSQLNDLEIREKELKMELLKLKERKMIGSINDKNETYSMLVRKQKYIHIAKKIKKHIEDLFKMDFAIEEINEKIDEAKDIKTQKLLINEKKDLIQSFYKGTYVGLNNSLWDIYDCYPEKKKVTYKEFMNIFDKDFNSKELVSEDDRISAIMQNTEKLISDMLYKSMANYKKLAIKITGIVIKNAAEFDQLNFYNEGTNKISHNHPLKTLVSRVVEKPDGEKLLRSEGRGIKNTKLITGEDYFKEFLKSHRHHHTSNISNKERSIV